MSIQPELKIHLANSTVILRGLPEEAEEELMCGQVVLTLPEPMRFKCLKLQFTAQIKIHLNDRKYCYCRRSLLPVSVLRREII